MCGIAGAIGAVDDQIVDAVRRMQRQMRHRGPDAEGLWMHRAPADLGVVLSHRRLSILDLSSGANQPMVDERSGCVIVFNGEIFNFADLRADLQQLGVEFHTTGDTEVLLQAYIHWGEGCLERLRGMFAFAIWDPRDETLFVARDRLGIKPLYITKVRTSSGQWAVLFASEVRALLDTGLVEHRIDPVGLASFLWNGLVMGPSTIVSGVRLMPTGTAQVFGLSGAMRATHRYWQLPRPTSETTDVSELQAELEKAVRLRMISDVPIAVFLSGGIDSSAIAALACRGADSQVKTFNLGFEEAEYDESSHARAVAKAIGTDHRELLLSERMFLSQLPDMLDSVDQPTLDGVNTYLVSRAVREAGITVALAGTGGDEIFGGYRSFVDIPRSLSARRLAAGIPSRLRNRMAQVITRIKVGPFGEVPPQARWGKLEDFLSTRTGLLETYQVAYGLFTRSFLQELSTRTIETGSYYGLPVSMASELRGLTNESYPLQSISNLELACYAGERLLRDTDVFSMAVGLEVRVPLLDHRVIEAAAKIETARRYEPLGRKQLLRDLTLNHLDKKIFERPKSGFQLPLEVWCRRQLKEVVDETMNDAELCARVGLNADAVARLWRAFLANAPGVHWLRVWAIFILLRWSRQHNMQL